MSGVIKNKFGLISTIIIVTILLAAVMFGFKKQGFYIDEFYVFTYANGNQLGIDIESGKWNDTSRYIGQLVSEGEENFNFRQTYETVERGVHPLLYYFLVHFVSSVFSGVFSKWIGLSINIILLIPILILVKKLAWKLSGENEIITLITIILYGLSPATISMVVLVRMYLLMSLWVVLYAYIHVADLERDKLSVGKFLFPVFVCGFCGFLSQYFYVVIMFFITFVYAFYLVFFCHRIKDTVIYGITALMSLICTYFVWPVSVFHVFKSRRGKGAFSQAKDVSNIWLHFTTHFKWMNELLFGKLIVLFIPFLIIGIYIIVKNLIKMRKDSPKLGLKSVSISTRGLILLGIASLLGFLCLAQIALMDGITCSRQLYGVYALFLLILPSGIYRVIGYLSNRSNWLSVVVPAVLVGITLISGYAQKSVLFVYEDEKVATDFARNHPDECVVIFHNDDGNYDSRIQEVIMYPEVFFALASDPSTARDDRIANADEILVYVTTSVSDPSECFNSIYEQNKNIKTAEHLWDSSNGFFSAYLLH